LKQSFAWVLQLPVCASIAHCSQVCAVEVVPPPLLPPDVPPLVPPDVPLLPPDVPPLVPPDVPPLLVPPDVPPFVELVVPITHHCVTANCARPHDWQLSQAKLDPSAAR
jgi:hypothetical protein